MAVELLAEIDEKFWSKGRLKTYKNWPFMSKDDTCTPERMAAAGFYVVEEEDNQDTVECFICTKQLDGWEATDNPWEEHAKHQSDCPFILLNKQDETIWTIDDLFNLVKLFYVKEGTQKMEEVLKNMKADSEAFMKKIPKIYKADRMNRKSGK